MAYNAEDKVLDPEGLKVIKDWLAAQVTGK
jgi:hypothetical protein